MNRIRTKHKNIDSVRSSSKTPQASADACTHRASNGVNTAQKPKVFVGLSGGVDSSVSAALLKENGYDVTGVFIRAWASDFFPCAWRDDRLDAMRVCAKLGILFQELNLEKEYKEEVVDYMIREYRSGSTPNPDVSCNRFIKFGAFYDWARSRGADFIATGHYARIRVRRTRGPRHGVSKNGRRAARFELLASSDRDKDQSYFLWQLRPEQLPHILFPVGGMRKEKVRELAKKFGLPTAGKKDSQGLCFVGKIDMKEFLSRYIRPKRGEMLDEDGATIGKHEGAAFYTLGERIGGGKQRAARGGGTGSKPLYVIAKDMGKNIVTAARKSQSGTLPRSRTEVAVRACNWLARPPSGSALYSARVRYRQPLERVSVLDGGSGSDTRGFGSGGRVPGRCRIRVRFHVPQIAVPGQSIVLYGEERVIGGGIIE